MKIVDKLAVVSFRDGIHLGAEQLRLDARHQLARRERLHQVVVRAGAQPFDSRLFAGARRQHQDASVSRASVGAQSRAEDRIRRASAS